MKNKRTLLIAIILIVATLACNLPFAQPEQASTQQPDEDFLKEPTEGIFGEETITGSFTDTESQVYSVGGYSILLPGSFFVSDNPTNVPILNELLSIVDEWTGEEFGDIAAIAEENIALLGYDTMDSSPIPSSMLVLKNEQFAGAPLGFMNIFAEQILGRSVNLLQSDSLQLGNRQVIRWQTSLNVHGQSSNQAIYFFNDYRVLWIIVFVTEPSMMTDRLLTFDDAVASFTFNGIE